jgi:serine/threonine-protein kinase RsbW
MSDDTICLSFPAKAEYLLLARLALSGLAREVSVDDEMLADLKLAVTEACGNAVRHAYPDGDGEILVRYSVSGGSLEMVVEDQGAGLGDADAEGTSAGRLDGGMGLSIMRAVVDEVDVRAGADDRGTVVRMVKRLAPVEA